MLGACAAGRPYLPQTYVVRPQDTLYSIAWRHNLDYRELAKWNNIGSDYRLSVGQVLMLEPGRAGAARVPPAAPKPAQRPSAAPPPGASGAPHVPRPGTPAPPPDSPAITPSEGDAARAPLVHPPGRGPAAVVGPTAAGPTAGAARGNAPAGRSGSSGTAQGNDAQSVALASGSAWLWPTDRTSAPRPVPGGGILLLGRLGQDVRAAGAGRVVYTGNGIRGYGNLIIIKHGDSLLSSYAHNREILVHEGQDVVAGQTIAHMGMGSHQISALYFEIRVNGKPTDPLRLLPQAK
jgi:lipoprotein NlpD